MQQRNQPVKVKVSFLRELHMRDPGTLHFLNVRLRHDLQRIQLVQLGRCAAISSFLINYHCKLPTRPLRLIIALEPPEITQAKRYSSG